MFAASIITAAATVGLAALAYFQIRAGRAQTKATLNIARETREAAQRQWQPRVFVHAWGDPVPGNGDNAAPDEMAVPYRLKNEGTGPAFNVEHGVEVAGNRHTWGDRQWPTMGAGEELPPMLDSIGLPVSLTPIAVGVKLAEWDDGKGLVYWSRFENLLGERFEVRNYPDPTRPAEFRARPPSTPEWTDVDGGKTRPRRNGWRDAFTGHPEGRGSLSRTWHLSGQIQAERVSESAPLRRFKKLTDVLLRRGRRQTK